MGIVERVRELFSGQEPNSDLGPKTQPGAAILGELHDDAAKCFGSSALELTQMWKYEIRLNPIMAELASGVDAQTVARPGATRELWLVSKPGDDQVMGVIGQYLEPNGKSIWVGTDVAGKLKWRSPDPAKPAQRKAVMHCMPG